MHIDFASENTLANFFAGHNLVRFGISNEGLVGGLLSDLVDGTNQFVCTTLGPNFLQILLDHCRDCPGGILPPTAFKSFESFCPYFNSETRKNRKCITDGVALIELPSIFQWTEIIGKCCTECTGNGKLKERNLVSSASLSEMLTNH